MEGIMGIKIYRTNKITKDDIGHEVEIVRPSFICRRNPPLADMLGATLYKTEGEASSVMLGKGAVGKLKNFERGYGLIQVGDQEFIYLDRGIEVIGKGRMKDIW